MIRIIKTAWLVVSVSVIAVYLASCLSPYVAPSKIGFISVLGLLFIYLFIAAFCCCITLFFIRKKTAAGIMALMLLAGSKNISNTVALHTGEWTMARKDGTLRVMTWNVYNFITLVPQTNPGAKKRIDMLRAIDKYKPDILCVQEFTDVENYDKSVSVKHELDSLGYKYSFLSDDNVTTPVLDNHLARVSTGVAIFSRLPILDSGRIQLTDEAENGEKNLVYADVMLQHKPVRIFTKHLLSFKYTGSTGEDDKTRTYRVPHTRKKISLSTITETEKGHEKEVSAIRGLIDKSPGAVIYCGDINSTPASYTYNKLKGSMQDAFLKKGFGIGTTFYGRLYFFRIDVCLVDATLKVEQCTVPKLYLSDHFPVVTDVSWE